MATWSCREVVIDVRDVQAEEPRDVFPTHKRVVGSYNWGTGLPILYVPGHPPLLDPFKIHERFKLRRDIIGGDGHGEWRQQQPREYGAEGRDVDDYLTMAQPSKIDALLRAVKVCSPELEFAGVDIIADQYVLLQLLRFCGSPGNSGQRPRIWRDEDDYKFVVHSMYNEEDDVGGVDTPTLVFTRFSSSVAHHRKSDCQKEKKVAGNSYSRQYRAKVTGREEGHPAEADTVFFLITEMELDGIKLLVRMKVDACLRASNARSQATPTDGARDAKQPESVDTDRSSEAAAHPVSCGKGEWPAPTSTIVTTGELLRSEDYIVDISTKNTSFKHEIDWPHMYWKLAVGGTDELVVGLHRYGTFNGSKKDKPWRLSTEKVMGFAGLKRRDSSTSMIYLANTLREIANAARNILPLCRPVIFDGARRRVAVVDFPRTTEGATQKVRVHIYKG